MAVARTLVTLGVLVLPMITVASPASTCFGTTANGHLEGGVKLPASGPNFISYGIIPSLAGRTFVHSRVKEIMLDAWHSLESELPEKVYQYAETGLREGGEFTPHKTHRNGLSVDFMTPVIDEAGESVHLPTHAFNRYGYDIEFDNAGRYGGYRIDYEALAGHLVALDRAARQKGAGLWRVLFDPALQAPLYKTRYGDYISRHIQLARKRSWVRHDEHYHVDFDVPCESLD